MYNETTSGARTNLKVGGTGPERKNTDPVRRAVMFFGRAFPLFGSRSTISRFGERSRDGQYSLVSFLFAVLLLTVHPRAQPFLKVGARAPRAPWSRRHWRQDRYE